MSVSLLVPSSGAAQRHRFHDLVISDREQLTDRAVALTFAVPDELASLFLRFDAGQHLTLRADIGVIFQDFVRYHMTAAENIAVGRIEARATGHASRPRRHAALPTR